ncbi:hypothetical protein [Streptomyces viridochromogenes]|uniref:hypothetical protein n=1 Tax=Streptomyces viridochromogenes TaxID=1938 RepID=UPI000B145017
MADVTAADHYIAYWWPSVPVWATAASALGVPFVANLVSVKLFGEPEFWFAAIKVVAVVAMIFIGVGVLTFGVLLRRGHRLRHPSVGRRRLRAQRHLPGAARHVGTDSRSGSGRRSRSRFPGDHRIRIAGSPDRRTAGSPGAPGSRPAHPFVLPRCDHRLDRRPTFVGDQIA